MANINHIDEPRRRSSDFEPPKGVRFDATVNLGHILTFIGFIVTALSMWQLMDKRVTVLEEFKLNQAQTDRRQDAVVEEAKNTTRADLREINQKLDRLIERRQEESRQR